MKTVSNREYWEAYWGLGAPVRLGRVRKAVRMSRHDIADLYARAWENVRDAAPWGVLADALDEEGKPEAAGLMRQLAANVPAAGDNALRGGAAIAGEELSRMMASRAPQTVGHVAGVPMLVYPMARGSSGGGPHAWGVYLYHPAGLDRVESHYGQFRVPHLWAFLGEPEGRRLLHEQDGPAYSHLGFDSYNVHPDTMKERYPLPGPERMRRPTA